MLLLLKGSKEALTVLIVTHDIPVEGVKRSQNSFNCYCHGMTKSVRKINWLTKMLFWPVSCVSLISLTEI